MRNLILYIGGQRVDTDAQTLIQMNYSTEELTNPTIIKNSYSQKVKLKGTPRNNAIFGHFFRLDRHTSPEEGSYVGGAFNPLTKTPFAIYDDANTIIESGYAKLEEVLRKGSDVEYQITLYGGLGEFFYELSYKENGDKKTLADIDFFGSDAPEEELNFNITAEAVREAWGYLNGENNVSKWGVINFAPMYNGLPDDFSSDVALLNPVDMGVEGTVTVDGVQYSTYNGFAKVELAKECTAWETKDLRSYLQRPVYSIKSTIEAMCQPRNNGGHTVNLDPSFFNENNPYWDKAWATLPQMNTIEREVEVTTEALVYPITSAGTGSTSYYTTVNKDGGRTSAKIKLRLKAITDYAGDEGDELELAENKDVSIMVTAVGTDYNTIQQQQVTISYRDGVFQYTNGEWLWSSAVEFTFNELNNVQLFTLVLTVESLKLDIPPDYEKTITADGMGLVQDSTIEFVPYETARSGVEVTKNMLLDTESTPADYLLSYAKLFGLQFIYDRGSREITICTRNTLYTGEEVDIENRIDKSKNVKIVPFVFDAKWYDFKFETDESEYAEFYEKNNGRIYGMRRINTGYPFDADAKDILDGNVFKGGVEVSERNTYFVNLYDIPNEHLPLQRTYIPSPFIDGSMKMTLRNYAGEETEVDVYKAWNTVKYFNDIYKTYDIDPKLQMHDTDDGAIDARDVLLFFRGVHNTSTYGFGAYSEFHLTDDSSIMGALNDGDPCWILNGVENIDIIPSFGRYIYDGGQIVSSWDFGIPVEIDIPDIGHAAGATLYEKSWDRYLGDRYDVDSKVVTCSVDFRGIDVGAQLLRKFFYFGNCWWVLNKIKNFNLTGHQPVECEFVKVKEKNNYTDGQIWQ